MGCTNAKLEVTEFNKASDASRIAVTISEGVSIYQQFLKDHPSGNISREGFRTMLRTCCPGMDTDAVEKHIFRMYDTNMDGYIDFKEFILAQSIMSAGTPEQNLEQIFRVFDINGDGTISCREMRKIVEDLFRLLSKDDNPAKESEEALALMAFEEMDSDMDGNITKNEFITACLNHEAISTLLASKIIQVFIPDDEDE